MEVGRVEAEGDGGGNEEKDEEERGGDKKDKTERESDEGGIRKVSRADEVASYHLLKYNCSSHFDYFS